MKLIAPTVFTLASVSSVYANQISTRHRREVSSEEFVDEAAHNVHVDEAMNAMMEECTDNPEIADSPFCIKLRNPADPRTADPNFRKLKQMKLLILWLQPEHRFARYCYYGCWCLPDADHSDFTPQYGQPVDPIDASCKRMSQCYDCAKRDYGNTCESVDTGYKYELIADEDEPDNHWKKSIRCLNDPKNDKHGCRRSICECDKQLAEDLRENFTHWFQGHHQTQGDFDTSICEPDHNGNGGSGGGPLKCCGNKDGPRFPYRDNGSRKCCGDKTYDSNFQECCTGNEVKFTGGC